MEDKAWVEFITPLNVKALFHFCNDIEILFRLNPYLDIKHWEYISENSYRLEATNYSQIPEFYVDTRFEKSSAKNEINIQYGTGIKSNTTFSIKATTKGSQLTIADHYHSQHNTGVKDYLTQVDRSLQKWGEEIQQFLIRWNRWSWFPLWRLYKLRIWLPMKPFARRVTDMLLIVSAVEVLLIVTGTIFYLLFYK